MKKFRRNLKGISTIIATIIIVAIAIVMAIAVAYWALGIGGSFTRFEKLQFTSSYVTTNSNIDTIHLVMKNTGTTTATFDPTMIQLNGVPILYSADVVQTFDTPTTSIDAGKTANGTIVLTTGTTSTWSSGMNVEVKIVTSAGNQYPQVVVLP